MLPLYSRVDLRPPAYHLRYTWSGWPFDIAAALQRRHPARRLT